MSCACGHEHLHCGRERPVGVVAVGLEEELVLYRVVSYYKFIAFAVTVHF